VTYLVPRTCTEIRRSRDRDPDSVPNQHFNVYRNTDAYVLLGEPGAGKTTEFDQETKSSGGVPISARDFITYDDRPDWHTGTLFIDGLDEVRASAGDARSPFDRIRAQLDRLGRPRFRLSCREADWLGPGDEAKLAQVSPNGRIVELHLDLLNDDNIHHILANHRRVSDATAFIDESERRGLSDLLQNPQTLNMLVDAVAGDQWPTTRLETFELACQTLIREFNREHIDALRNLPVDVAGQIHAAGFLFALQLIANTVGYAVNPAAADESCPALTDLGFGEPELLQRVIKSRLFNGPEECRTYVHRSVAEFLAARYLADRIDHHGLPLGRVLSLLTGEDRGVATALRGLFAWLAAVCASERSTLIEFDPLGLVLYGDPKNFSLRDKQRILDGLKREATRYPAFRRSNSAERPFGALATPDMEPAFHAVLKSSDRSEAQQALADCVLDALEHGDHLVGLADDLVATVRDATWWPGIRRQTLRVFIRLTRPDANKDQRLVELLDDINDTKVADPEDDLLGTLLHELYPRAIDPARLLNYLHVPKDPDYLGRYVLFWSHLAERSPAAALAELLDELAVRKNDLQPALDSISLRRMSSRLLARGLETAGDTIDAGRLFKWLGAGLDRHGFPQLDSKNEARRIRSWLEDHPDAQKAIIDHGLGQCAGSEDLDACMLEVQKRLFHAAPPHDLGAWCLNRMTAATNDPEARFLLSEAARSLWSSRETSGLSLDLLQSAVAQSPKLQHWLDKLLVCPIHREDEEYARQRRERREKQQADKRAWLNFVASNEAEVRDGRASPHLLGDLASAYYGYFIDAKGDTPRERLIDFLDGNELLVQAALAGFRRTLERDDVPSVEDILRKFSEDESYFLSRPFLAGIDEISGDAADAVLSLDDRQIRQALAFRFVEGTAEDRVWYGCLVERRADLVADTIVAYGTAALRDGKEHVMGPYALAYDPAHAGVAQRAALPLLDKFPARCTNRQLSNLEYLLKAAVQHADHGQLLSLIEKRLTLHSMNMAQRVRWLATGLLVAPPAYEEDLAAYVTGYPNRVQHLAGFLSDRDDQLAVTDAMPISAMAMLIQLAGSIVAPYELRGTRTVTPAIDAADLIGRLITKLESIPNDEANRALEDLLALDELARWHTALRGALYRQRRALREAKFQYPTIDEVSRTIQNLAPANVADLAALTLDHLRDLKKHIRDADTDDYKQYWELDQLKPVKPRHEEACRDALLSDIRQRLARLGVDSQPEGHYADDKRADIEVSYGGFNVPIEIKKNSHKDLWHAIHDQLIAKYSRDPGAYGYGIYLVLWFGPEYTKAVSPEGGRPNSALELENRLKASVEADEAGRRISVCAIDCSWPRNSDRMASSSAAVSA